MDVYPPTPSLTTGMTSADASRNPASPDRDRRRVNWGAVVGFGTLGLLWPLLRLLGLGTLIGELGTALAAFLATALVWVLGAGLGNVPLPVVTLTLSGVLFGGLLIATTVLLREWPDYGIALNLTGAAIEIGRAAGFGALAGVVASAIQRSRRRRG